MSHNPHEGPRRVLDDKCEECLERCRTLDGLSALDPENLRKLGQLDRELRANGGVKPPDASHADLKAVETLRHAARLVVLADFTTLGVS